MVWAARLTRFLLLKGHSKQVLCIFFQNIISVMDYDVIC